MHSIPIILVGCGAVSRMFYLPAIQYLESRHELSLVAAIDRTPTAAAPILSAFPQARFCQSIDEVPDPGPGTLAIIASPPGFHKQHTLAAAQRGWHVLCEKPMAANSADCREMIEGCARAGVSLSVGHYKRFFPASAQLKALCSGLTPLGKLRSYEIHEGGPFGWPSTSTSFFQKSETPGGVLLDIGIHVFDLLLWWLGEPNALTHEDDAMGGLEINSQTRFQHGDIQGSIRLSRDWITPQRYHFTFERGEADWTVNDANHLNVTINGLPHPLHAQLLERAKPALSNPQSFIAQLKHTLGVVRGGQAPLVGGQEARAALNLVERCYKAKTLLDQPWLSPLERKNAAIQAGTA